MARTEINLKQEIRKLKFELHFLEDMPCSKAENQEFKQMKQEGRKLPDDVKEYYNDIGQGQEAFYREKVNILTDEEMKEYMELKQLQSYRNVERIKNCAVVLTITFCVALFVLFTK